MPRTWSLLVGLGISLSGCVRIGYGEQPGEAGTVEALDGGSDPTRDGSVPQQDAGDASPGADAAPQPSSDSGTPADGGGNPADGGPMEGGTPDGAVDAGPEAGADAAPEAGVDAGPSDWSDALWAHRKTVTVHASEVPATQTAFPLLVRWTSDATFASQVRRSDGGDIYFTSLDGTRLPHEIELFDSSTGRLAAWVLVPSVSATTDTVLYMYYGNPGAIDQQDASTLWSSYVAVHHLSSLLDSTANHHDASVVGNASIAPSDGIGNSALVDGVGDGYTLGDINALDGVATMTVSVWVRMNVYSSIQGVLGKTNSGSTTGWGLSSGSSSGPEGTNDVAVNVGPLGAGGSGDTTNSNVLVLNRPQLWVMVYNGSAATQSARIRVYVDGAEIATTAFGSPIPATTPSTSHPVQIATTTFQPTTSVNGMVDEVRYSARVRSASWIATEYESQRTGSSMVSVSAVESLP